MYLKWVIQKMMVRDNEKKGSRQVMEEDIITKILDRNNLNEAFKMLKQIKEQVELMIYQLRKQQNI